MLSATLLQSRTSRRAASAIALVFIVLVLLRFPSASLKPPAPSSDAEVAVQVSPSSSHMKPPRIQDSKAQLLVTIVKSLEEVTGDVWNSLQDMCASRKTIISILYSTGSLSLIKQHMLEEYCHDVIVLRQEDAEKSVEYKEKEDYYKRSRIGRLGMLRSWQRGQLVKQSAMVASLDVVVVIDLDVLTFPTESSLSKAIATVNSQGKEGVVCANGYEEWLFMRHYYDTFALVLADGTWAFPLLTSAKAIFLRLQHKFYEKVRTSAQNYQVRSCFGGLAVYNVEQFFNLNCDYRTVEDSPADLMDAVRQYSNSDGEACEHVIFHACLGLARNGTSGEGIGIKVGIQPDLQLSRSAAIGGWNNATLVYIVLSALILSGLVVLCNMHFSNGGGSGGGWRRVDFWRLALAHFGVLLKKSERKRSSADGTNSSNNSSRQRKSSDESGYPVDDMEAGLRRNSKYKILNSRSTPNFKYVR